MCVGCNLRHVYQNHLSFYFHKMLFLQYCNNVTITTECYIHDSGESNQILNKSETTTTS